MGGSSRSGRQLISTALSNLAAVGAEVPLGDGGPRDVYLSWGDVAIGPTAARLNPGAVVVLG